MEGIKEACERHFALEDMSCNILANDQGLSCTSMEHIPDFIKDSLQVKGIMKSFQLSPW